MRGGNSARWLRGTLRTAGIITALLVPVLSDATQAPPGAADEVLPQRATARRAFALVRAWADNLEAPAMDDPASRCDLAMGGRGVAGVNVLLRRHGRVVGMAAESAGDDLALRRAAGRALNDVLGEAALQRLLMQIEKEHPEREEAEAAARALLRGVGRSLIVEVELAGRPLPLVGRTLEQLAAKVQPGLDGMAVRRAGAGGQSDEEHGWRLAFPSGLLATDTAADPQQALIRLAMEAGVGIGEVPTLGARGDVAVYRFRTVHLAQRVSGGEPVELFRGDEIVPPAAVTREAIASLAEGLAAHLAASMFPEPPPPDAAADDPSLAQGRRPLGLMGDYQIVSDSYQPLVAPPFDQALAAWALLRYGRSRETGPEPAARALALGLRILRELDAVSVGEDDPRQDAVACAVIVLAVAEHPGARQDAAIRRLLDDAAGIIAEAYDPVEGFRQTELRRGGGGAADRSPRAIKAEAHPILAAALARLLLRHAQLETPKPDAERVRLAIDVAWQAAPRPQWVALLPWIGWAEHDFAEATGMALGRADDLRMLCGLLGRIRLGGEQATRAAPLDMVGGLALTSAGADGTRGEPVATSQSLRPTLWLATVLDEPALVPLDQRAATQAGHLLTLRFIIQLTVGQDDAATLRHPARALGGVRDALWSRRQPVVAQALALATAVATLEALAAQTPATENTAVESPPAR